MNILEILFSKKTKKESDRSATDEELRDIKLFIDNIADSALVDDSESIRGVNVYKYSDSLFTIIKIIYFNSDGSKKIRRSIVLEDGFEVYNGNVAVKVNKWLKHLSDINDAALREPRKRLTFNYK